ncbi:MAG TPA: Clp protease N-terminal domain-containing protein [Actinopolymorphaceae bacterium]
MAPAPHLRELIELVRHDAGSEDPREQLATAARTARELDELGDKLLGHYVENARSNGLSWIAISETLGVTKQAVHKRFAVGADFPPMHRFTERTRTVVEAAEAAAVGLNHHYIGTEHLLLAFFAEPECIATRVLRAADIDRDRVEDGILRRVGRGERPPKGRLVYTPKAVHAFERTLQAALDWGHDYIGTEHLLVALYGDDGGIAGELLAEFGLEEQVVKARIVEVLADYRRADA